MAHILVVEDDPGCQAIIRLALEPAYTVVLASTAEQALLYLAHVRFELAIVDLMLPGISGVMLARQLRADPAHGRMPLVGLTAAVDRKGEAREAGLQPVLSKPFSPRALKRVVDEVLRGETPGGLAERAGIWRVK